MGEIRNITYLTPQRATSRSFILQKSPASVPRLATRTSAQPVKNICKIKMVNLRKIKKVNLRKLSKIKKVKLSKMKMIP